MIFVIDASVHLNALNPAEPGSAESQTLLTRLFERRWPVFSPTLLLVEVAAAVARVFNDAARGLAIARAIRELQGQVWITLDEHLASEAARLATEARLRGADAVYGAIAHRYGATLVTLDGQQLQRLPPHCVTLSPAQALAKLA